MREWRGGANSTQEREKKPPSCGLDTQWTCESIPFCFPPPPPPGADGGGGDPKQRLGFCLSYIYTYIYSIDLRLSPLKSEILPLFAKSMAGGVFFFRARTSRVGLQKGGEGGREVRCFFFERKKDENCVLEGREREERGKGGERGRERWWGGEGKGGEDFPPDYDNTVRG